MTETTAKIPTTDERIRAIITFFGFLILCVMALVIGSSFILSNELEDVKTVIRVLLQNDGIRQTLYEESLTSLDWKDQHVLERMASHLRDMERHKARVRLEEAERPKKLKDFFEGVDDVMIYAFQEMMEREFRNTRRGAQQRLADETEARQKQLKLEDDMFRTRVSWAGYMDSDGNWITGCKQSSSESKQREPDAKAPTTEDIWREIEDDIKQYLADGRILDSSFPRQEFPPPGSLPNPELEP